MNSSSETARPDDFSVSIFTDYVFEQGQMVGGKYKIVSRLGSGGMGTVYRVHQVFLQKDFALKTLDSRRISDLAMRRFQLEAKAASVLNHPNLVQVHDFGLLDNKQPYLVMDFIEGITLAQYLRENGPLSLEKAAPLLAQACLGLAYAHGQGVVHRDIKPSNIMLVNDREPGAEGSVKVVDFGIAKLTNNEDGEIQALTRTGEIFGSPLYMSPEQCSGGAIDHCSDVYSLGCVLFEVLTGTPPHLGQNALSTMMLHQTQSAPSLREASLGKEFPEALEQVVARMLSKNPQQRHQNLGAVAHQLAGVCKDVTVCDTRTSRKVLNKPHKTVTMTAGSFYSALTISALCAATVSGLSVNSFWQSLTPSGAAAQQISNESKDGSTYNTGLLESLEEVKADKIPSVKSISNVLQADAKKRRLVFPESGIGTVWIAERGLRTTPALGPAKGTVFAPWDTSLTLDINESTLSNPAILKAVLPDAFNGLSFRGLKSARSQASLPDNLVKTLKIAASWSDLKSITLIDCPVNDSLLRSLDQLTELQYLEIGSPTGLNSSALIREPFFRRLKGVYLHKFDANDIVGKIADSPNLQYLVLTDTGVTADRLQELRRCRRLKSIAYIDTKNRPIDTRIFQSITQMKTVCAVGFRQLDEAQLKSLLRCAGIKTILLWAHAYSVADRSRLKSRDPRISFQY